MTKKQNSMVRANIKIIEDLKGFLERIKHDSQLKEAVTQSKEDFIRDRKLTLERVASLIINAPKRSLSIEVREFFDCLGVASACTKGAFSLQRTKLKPLFFELWNQCLVDSFYKHYADKVKRWKGFRLLAVDGSTAYLINKPEIVAHFGTQYNQHMSIPIARIMQIHDVLNDLTVWGEIYPFRQGEQAIMARQVSRLYEDSITLFDRAYPSYTLMYQLMGGQKTRHFVMRCKSDFNKEISKFVASHKRDTVIELRPPSAKAVAMLAELGHSVTKSTTIKLRAVKITLASKQQELLLTNLYDKKLYPIKDLKYLYSLRWAAETTYCKQKNQQQIEQFSGHRVICIEQDYKAALIVANLQSLIEKQCAPYVAQLSERRKYCYKINRNVSWAALKNNVVRLFLQNDPETILLYLQKRFEQNTEPVRLGRHYPRNNTKRVKRSKGKYQTITNYRRAV